MVHDSHFVIYCNKTLTEGMNREPKDRSRRTNPRIDWRNEKSQPVIIGPRQDDQTHATPSIVWSALETYRRRENERRDVFEDRLCEASESVEIQLQRMNCIQFDDMTSCRTQVFQKISQ